MITLSEADDRENKFEMFQTIISFKFDIIWCENFVKN